MTLTIIWLTFIITCVGFDISHNIKRLAQAIEDLKEEEQ